MSVKELVLGDSPIKIKAVYANNRLYLTLYDHKVIGGIDLDLNQVDMLRLYLEEHLNGRPQRT